MLFYSLVLCFEIPLAIQNVVFPFYQCLRVFQPLNLVTSAKEHTTNSFFDLINNNSSCISYRINIALFVVLEKKVSKEDGRSRQECLGQTWSCKWMASINVNSAVKFNGAIPGSCWQGSVLDFQVHPSIPTACRWALNARLADLLVVVGRNEDGAGEALVVTRVAHGVLHWKRCAVHYSSSMVGLWLFGQFSSKFLSTFSNLSRLLFFFVSIEAAGMASFCFIHEVLFV